MEIWKERTVSDSSFTVWVFKSKETAKRPEFDYQKQQRMRVWVFKSKETAKRRSI